ncbi:MAG TPA: thiamine-phosphate kinase [Opitutales bacterium]|nr:thiamine-phosphate kinase [Opitutales bacterium]
MNAFSNDRSLTAASLGETALLSRIREWLGPCAPPSPRGMGDDCAVIEPGANLLTCDSVVFARHFEVSTPPDMVGAKLLKRNLSDIAAMGGIPREAVVALFLPPETTLEWLEGFTKGLAKCALDYSVSIVGGDISQSPTLAATLTLTGRARRPLTRGTGGAGDILCVTGPLGASIKGHHLTFTPRIEQGIFLSINDAATACMDLSDGLAKDAPSLAGEHLAAVLDLDEIPPSAEALEQSDGDAAKLTKSVLCDGEDYELLFAVKADAVDALEEAWVDRFGAPFFRIGHLAPRGDGPALVDSATGKAPEGAHGYEHLR